MGVPVADRKPLNAVKYAAKDYASIFDSLLRRLKVEYANVYNDYASTAVGIMLIDLMANAIGQLCWYMDRVASDCYLDTARTHAAVSKLVKQIGYKMRPASAATVDLALTFTPAIPAPAQLQAGFRFGGPSGLIFETVAPTFLAPGITTITVACREGTSRTVGYTGDGTQNQRFRLQGADPVNGVWLAQGSVRGWIDGAEWAENDFLDFAKTNQFEVDYLFDPPALVCGDGVAGNIPEAGSDVKIQYTLIHGAAGRAAEGTITTVMDVLTVGGTAIKIACTNPMGASGGADPETPDEARKLAPYAFAARGAAITQTDYQAQVNGFSDPLYGRVAKGYAINVRAAAEDAVVVEECERIDGYLANYLLLVTPMEAAVAADVATAQALLEEIAAILVVMQTTLKSALEVQAANVRTAAQALQVEMSTGKAAYGVMGSTLTDLDTYIKATYPSDTELANFSKTLTAQGSAISTSLNNGSSAATSLDGYGFNLQQLLTPTGAGKATLAQDLLTLIDLVGQTSTAVSEAAAAIDPLPGSAAQLQADILAAVADLQAHLSTLFDADCKANYVQVPIVSVNGDGDYVAPAAGLIYGLQTYLDGIKEVSQLVQVVDGSAMLVPVDVTVAVKVLPSYVAAEVLADIEQALLEVLRGRDFAQPLYKQFVHDTIKAATKGMEYANVTLAEAAFVDAEGNVVPLASYIITRGTITLTEIK